MQSKYKFTIKYDECNHMKYELNTCLCMLPWIALQSKALAPFLNIWFIVVLSLAVHGLIIIQQDNVIWNMFQAEDLSLSIMTQFMSWLLSEKISLHLIKSLVT